MYSGCLAAIPHCVVSIVEKGKTVGLRQSFGGRGGQAVQRQGELHAPNGKFVDLRPHGSFPSEIIARCLPVAEVVAFIQTLDRSSGYSCPITSTPFHPIRGTQKQ